ncbi:MAG: Alanine-tRNA ligase, eukaryota/bacteria, partial [Anaerospora sp.]|nr:Alanine-tRNA ligase, eukaryota/bacteria [Anaerospora sp.]
RTDVESKVILPDLSQLATDTLSYKENAENAKLVLLSKEGRVVDEIHDGEEVLIILDVTPFHAEGGGQVGDIGHITGAMGKAEVLQTRKLPDGTTYQLGIVTEGFLKAGEAVALTVDVSRRRAVARNHTATHLLHAALKTVLGDHVNQAGSQVGPDRLRFFTFRGSYTSAAD